MDRWGELAGYARILPFDARRGAAYYCAKYVTKQNGDWDLSSDLAAFAHYQPVLPLTGPTKLPVPKVVVARTDAVTGHKKQPMLSTERLLISVEQRGEPISDPVFDVYASEVTRGRGRFRQFCFPEELKSK